MTYYQRGWDYSVQTIGDTVEIYRMPGGRIVDEQFRPLKGRVVLPHAVITEANESQLAEYLRACTAGDVRLEIGQQLAARRGVRYVGIQKRTANRHRVESPRVVVRIRHIVRVINEHAKARIRRNDIGAAAHTC